MEDFTTMDLYWKDVKKKKYLKMLEILNDLTEEQKIAVRLYGESRLYKGCDEAMDVGY